MTKAMTGFLLLIVAAFQIGCSVEAESPFAKVQPEKFEDKVTGPDVEGTWASLCTYDEGSQYNDKDSQYRVRKIVFDKNKVVRIDNTYFDKECRKIKTTSELKGVYRWGNVTSYGGYLVDYRFDLGNGITSITAEEVLIEKGVMYLSDFYIGFGSIDKSLPLFHENEGENPSQPEPDEDPTNVVGVKAYSWADAHYAFCNVQGFAVFIDFKNQNLSVVDQGTADITSRVCNTKNKFKSMGSMAFSLNRSGKFMMTFDDGYIEDNGSGLSDTWAVLYGNSGMCTYLKNKGIKGIFNTGTIWKCE